MGPSAVDGGGKLYALSTSLDVPAGVELRSARLILQTPGMKGVRMNSGSAVRDIEITGTGTVGVPEAGIVAASDDASDVLLDVSLQDLTVGVWMQPRSSDSLIVPRRWKGTIRVHRIIGSPGRSEGYGLLALAEDCEFGVIASDIERHAVYLTAGASRNRVHFEVDGCRQIAVQVNTYPRQRPSSDNLLTGKLRNVKAGGLWIGGKSRNNTASVDILSTGETEYAVMCEGDASAFETLARGNVIRDCRATGVFSGPAVFDDLCGDANQWLRLSGAARAKYAWIRLLYASGQPRPQHGGTIAGCEIDCMGSDIVPIWPQVQEGVPVVIDGNTVRNSSAVEMVRKTELKGPRIGRD
jgi:hypothetical protein